MRWYAGWHADFQILDKKYLFSGSGVGTVICISNKDPRWKSLIWENFPWGNKCSFAWEITLIGSYGSANVGTGFILIREVKKKKDERYIFFYFTTKEGLRVFLLSALVSLEAWIRKRKNLGLAPRKQAAVKGEVGVSHCLQEVHGE